MKKIRTDSPADAIEPYITGKASTCSYCDHLDPLILLEGKDTYITLAIGQIVEGYVQVCAQKHRTGVTALNLEEALEFSQMKSLVRQAFREVYGTTGIAFEHGKAGSCLWGEAEAQKNITELCYHCHVHMVPVDVDIRPRISALLPIEYQVGSIEQMKVFRELALDGSPYLYFEDSLERGFLYPVDDARIPRQFLRTCVALELGLAERADWIAHPGTELFDLGRARLQPVLQGLSQKALAK
jgi:hypothetical protein